MKMQRRLEFWHSVRGNGFPREEKRKEQYLSIFIAILRLTFQISFNAEIPMLKELIENKLKLVKI